MTDLGMLLRQIIELERTIHCSHPTGRSTVWRWVLSPDAVDLLRRHAGLQDQASVNLDIDGRLEVFGKPVRLDEHIEAPMLELRLREAA